MPPVEAKGQSQRHRVTSDISAFFRTIRVCTPTLHRYTAVLYIHVNSSFNLLLYSTYNKIHIRPCECIGPFANKTTNELSTTTSPRLAAWGKVSINVRVKSISSFKSTALQNARLWETYQKNKLRARKYATKLLLKIQNWKSRRRTIICDSLIHVR